MTPFQLLVKDSKLRLKELRKDKGLTQADLAKVINTNQSQYGKYENGKTSLSIENSKILADFFGVSIPYLLGLDDTPTLVNPRGTIPSKWMQELFSISHKKSELLQEYMELDKREKAILKQIMENLNAP